MKLARGTTAAVRHARDAKQPVEIIYLFGK